MFKRFAFLSLLLLGACDDPYYDLKNEQNVMDTEIEKNGFVEVGKTPDGRPLLMTRIDRGFIHDNVYFAGDNITAVEPCGKNCKKSVTTLSNKTN